MLRRRRFDDTVVIVHIGMYGLLGNIYHWFNGRRVGTLGYIHAFTFTYICWRHYNPSSRWVCLGGLHMYVARTIKLRLTPALSTESIVGYTILACRYYLRLFWYQSHGKTCLTTTIIFAVVD